MVGNEYKFFTGQYMQFVGRIESNCHSLSPAVGSECLPAGAEYSVALKAALVGRSQTINHTGISAY